MTAPLVPGTCVRVPAGWWCTLDLDHDGPCPARPITRTRTIFDSRCDCGHWTPPRLNWRRVTLDKVLHDVLRHPGYWLRRLVRVGRA